jgi:hypothetical protein
MVVTIYVSPIAAAESQDGATERKYKDITKEIEWLNATDAERYNMPTEMKAFACDLSVNDFKFFAKVVEAEGEDDPDNITDKVFIAYTVLNRVHCKRWPTKTVISTLKRPGQFTVVDRETGECPFARSLDSEWAIVIAYRMFENHELSCHMVYYNSIGFTGYSRAFANYAYFGGNYFSCVPCDCEFCKDLEPDFKKEDVEMIPDDFEILRPEGIEANYVA